MCALNVFDLIFFFFRYIIIPGKFGFARLSVCRLTDSVRLTVGTCVCFMPLNY